VIWAILFPALKKAFLAFWGGAPLDKTSDILIPVPSHRANQDQGLVQWLINAENCRLLSHSGWRAGHQLHTLDPKGLTIARKENGLGRGWASALRPQFLVFPGLASLHDKDSTSTCMGILFICLCKYS
jgi:hypothetical protein